MPQRLTLALPAFLLVASAATIAPRAAGPTLPAETLLDRAVLTALDEELSGVAAKDHVSRLTQFHRVPASPGFHEAIEYVMGRAKAFGLSDVHVETFPGDGTTYFRTLHGNRGWRVDGGSLDEVKPRPRRIISVDDVRLAVADNSESADVTVELVDVGGGAERRDYDGKDVRGRLVLCDATPSACHAQAVEEHGAVGLVSYNSNQVSAWWRDDADLIRWGHLDARGRKNTFAMMISLREARSLRQRLGNGERITLHAVVRARNDDTLPYETLIATIPGADPAAGDIVFSCHLDHEKPGANDNASGCSANLEIARALKTLIDHWIYQEGGFGIPSIYLRDHPDIYIHTTGDLADNIEPTKIKRSAFIAAASGYYLATMPDRGASLLRLSYANAHERLAEDGRRAAAMASNPAHVGEAATIVAQGVLREQRRLRSLERFGLGSRPDAPDAAELSAGLARTATSILLTFMPRTGAEQLARAGFHRPSTDPRVPVRNASVRGPLAPDGEWVLDRAGAGRSTSTAISRLPRSDDLTYEVANFIDGVRSVGEIRDAVSAEFEPLDLKAVAEYIELLARAGAVTFRK